MTKKSAVKSKLTTDEVKVTVKPVVKDIIPPPVEVVAEPAKLTKGKSANASCPPTMEKILYGRGVMFDKYNPRKAHTIEAWEKVRKCMTVKGVASHSELCDALCEHFTKTDENHHDFIGYMVRRSSLTIAS